MTGRIFFLRYPQVYDFMLEKLQEVSSEESSTVLRPSLYPVLLLLARLYPSSLEGTVSNLKLVAFVPHVMSCASSSVLKTRQLAAKAIVPLISPEMYIPHIESTLELVQHEHTKTNHRHGLLLQLGRLLQAGARAGGLAVWHWGPHVRPALRYLRGPCYPVADELVKLINLLVLRSPTAPQDIINEICSHLHTLIFETVPTPISAGRDVCLANAMYLYFILATRYHVTDLTSLVHRALQHKSYEVILTVLNYLLILHKQLEPDNNMFHEHLVSIADPSTLKEIKNKQYIQLLCDVLKSHYMECREKSLKILVLEGNTQRDIIETKTGVTVTDDMVIEKLIDCIQTEYETLTHTYLQSLVNFVSERIQEGSIHSRVVLNVVRTVYECSSAENCESTRKVAVSFIERNYMLFKLDTSQLTAAEQFELHATLWATIITLLEDDEEAIRQRVSRAVCPGARVAPARAARSLRAALRAAGDVALLGLVALLDFQSVVVMADDVSDECRVFDQNERYNIFLEESIWTIACADIIVNEHKVDNSKLLEIINRPEYEGTFQKLCQDNVEMYKKMATGHKIPRNEALNPKIQLLVDKLS
ncbi:uncharacterized protein LOC111356756 [Spodoptera litura]|uniref:Uncharacterized protein LOC111356756 n=1 Tax=Spodoptera litura TaxID=69820 RepID=A0A9J7EE50_SPOLT|nr:uncharacterized protein LOC111356756 [Spodoptera litura]